MSQRSKSSVENSSRASSELDLTVLGSKCPRGERLPKNSPSRPLILPIDRLIQYRSEIGSLEEGCTISGRSSSVSSQHPELAIDISSISDSYPGTQRSSDSSYAESDWSRPWFPKRKFQNSDSLTYEKISSRRTNESICTRCSSQLRDKATDLIDVYVKTVNNTELSKFFRPCTLCGQQSCNCPASDEKNCECPEEKSACLDCRMKYCLCLPKTMRNEPIRLAEQTVDSGNSTLQLDDSCRDVANRLESGILSRQHVSLSVMQLATAAQCARILADSLENVLQLAREELTPQASSRSGVLEFPRDSLLSAIDALNKTSSGEHNS